MKHLQNEMRKQALMAMQDSSRTRLGLVSSYDPNTYSAKVRLQPDDTETGWLPILTMWAGNGWGLFCPPSPGDQVKVVFQDGDPQAGIVAGLLFSDEDRPLSVPAGEFWLVHKAGASFKFTNDGRVALVTISDLTVTVGGALTATVTGDASLTTSGKATITANEADLISANVNLGGTGGKKIVLDGDPVTGGVVHATSTKVKAV